MKIIIGYPPLISNKGIPLLSQNRQFQWFKLPTYIYPVVPAYGATMLKKAGHKIFWLDGIAEGWSYQKWLREIKMVDSDLIIIETKTPVIKQHWKIINQLKAQSPKLKIVLVGDHVTALPEESFINSKVDYVLTGGDYDFLLVNLINHLNKREKLEPGIYYRNNTAMPALSKTEGKQYSNETMIKNTGKFELNHDLNSLPLIDRELTKWKLYAYKNGNYKRTPGTYIMAGRDCWWHQCQFCSWTTLYPQYRIRSVNNVLEEIGKLIKTFQVKEIMDDTGTFPNGKWLTDFCRRIIRKKYHKQINFNCNLRFGNLTEDDYQSMAKAGFRMLLFGLESANQKTLDRLNKGIKIDRVYQELESIQKVNKEVNGHLEPHLTVMIGYPWETKKQIEKTIAFVRDLFKKGLINSLQATLVIPYPGTPLFKEAIKNHWLKTSDWRRYDMKEPILKTSLTNSEINAYIKQFYQLSLSPEFIFNKIISIKSTDDFKFLLKAGIKMTGHLLDFPNS